jgi:hypothetical protein
MALDVLAAVTAITDRFTKLFESRRDTRRHFVKEELEPLWESFEALHSHYLDSFKEYRRRLREEDLTHSTIVDDIRRDHLFSEDLRNKVWSAAQVGPSDAAYPLKDFACECADYISNTFEDPMHLMSQIWRTSLLNALQFFLRASADDLESATEQFQHDRTFLLQRQGRMVQRIEINTDQIQVLREALAAAGSNIEERRRALCINALDVIVEVLQRRHRFVAMKYAEVHRILSA